MSITVNYAPGWTGGFNWMVYLGFVFSFFLAFGGGANDTANSFGVVVGSGVLKLWQAYILAAVFDTLGGALLGYSVTEAVQKMIVDVDVYTIYARNYTGVNDTTVWNASFNACPVNSTTTNSTLNLASDGACLPYTSAQFMAGEIGAMVGSAFWQVIATIFSMPVSTTQSTIGATVGFSLVLKGAEGIHWYTVYRTAASWLISPLLSGSVSSLFYLIVKWTVLARPDPYESSLTMLPFFFAFTILVIAFAVLYDGSKYLKLNTLSWWQALLIALAIATTVGLFVKFIFIKYIRKSTEHYREKAATVVHHENHQLSIISGKETKSIDLQPSQTHVGNGLPHNTDAERNDALVPHVRTGQPAEHHHTDHPRLHVNEELVRMRTDSIVAPGPAPQTGLFWNLLQKVQEDARTVRVFHYLQIVSACYLSFSHGTNDTANSVGPLVGLWVTWVYGYAGTDVSGDWRLLLLLLFGTTSGIVGVVCLAHRVIKTLGKDMTTVSAPSGICMELGAAFTILIGSKLRIPLSTTHCMVGSVTMVGWLRNREPLKWKLLGKIVFSWLVTLPVAGGVAALVAWGFVLGMFGSNPV